MTLTCYRNTTRWPIEQRWSTLVRSTTTPTELDRLCFRDRVDSVTEHMVHRLLRLVASNSAGAELLRRHCDNDLGLFATLPTQHVGMPAERPRRGNRQSALHRDTTSKTVT